MIENHWMRDQSRPNGFRSSEGTAFSLHHLYGAPQDEKPCSPVRSREPSKPLENSEFAAAGQFCAIGFMAGGGGFEPPLTGPEPVVIPLDDPPAESHQNYTMRVAAHRSGAPFDDA